MKSPKFSTVENMWKSHAMTSSVYVDKHRDLLESLLINPSISTCRLDVNFLDRDAVFLSTFSNPSQCIVCIEELVDVLQSSAASLEDEEVD